MKDGTASEENYKKNEALNKSNRDRFLTEFKSLSHQILKYPIQVDEFIMFKLD